MSEHGNAFEHEILLALTAGLPEVGLNEAITMPPRQWVESCAPRVAEAIEAVISEYVINEAISREENAFNQGYARERFVRVLRGVRALNEGTTHG